MIHPFNFADEQIEIMEIFQGPVPSQLHHPDSCLPHLFAESNPTFLWPPTNISE